MNKDHFAIFWQDNIRPSWKGSDIEPESEAFFVQVTADNAFWRCILPSYAGHHPATCFAIYNVYHLVERTQ